MAQLFNNLVSVMQSVPAVLIYLIAAVWLGLESAGIGVPIEPMLLFIGSLAAHGGTANSAPLVNPVLAVVATALGCLVFATVAYTIGKRVGTAAITHVGHYVGLNQQRADHVELWLRHRGAVGVFIARETPMVRTFGSYIMGAADIPFPVFALGTALGSLLYCGIFVTLGAVLGYERPLQALDAIGWRGVAIVVAVVVVYAVLHRLWSRFSLHRIAEHFRLHHPQSQTAAATVAHP
jgi:membrane-associated protein